MSELHEENKSGTRREFLLGAGVAAGGVALLGANRTAGAQTPQAAQPQVGDQPSSIRASAPVDQRLNQLGPLRELGGTWVGRGFNLISLPFFDNPAGPQAFRLKLNATRETLEFNQIGGRVPNRGSTGQDDINLFGFTYLQRISDSISSAAMHIEPGLWLNVPKTTVPDLPATIVRQGSIPHGTSIMALGTIIPTVNGGPKINPVDSTPVRNPAGAPLSAAYLTPFADPTLPPGFKPPYLKNPNLALEEAILGQNIVKTEVLSVSTVSPLVPNFSGVLNIPFLVSNANATRMEAIFWIETVHQPDGSRFMQLQYTQTVILNFLGIDWPHISVATLVKQ
jgi:hypothetical protein